MKRLLSCLFLALLIINSAIAQERIVKGTVKDGADGGLLPGVAIRVKGTTMGTQTGAKGEFSLRVPAGSEVILISYIGYKAQEINIANKSFVHVELKPDAAELGEVVVVAYGSAKKREITGSVASINSKDIEKRTVTNVTSALAGIAPGVNVNSGNGQPGSGASIRLRGFGSYNASNAPLYVVDGSVFDGDIGDLNQNDIEGISILKDATSSALYGARGGNGVIIITTKKGKLGQPQFNVNISQGYSTRGIPEYDRLNAQEYYPAMWEAMKNSLIYRSSGALDPVAAAQSATNNIKGQLRYNPFNVGDNQIVGTDGKLNPDASLMYDDFDWYSPMQRTGQRTDANLNYAGKNEKSDYFASFGYLKDNGYLLMTDFQRFNARMNVNTSIKKWLKTGLNLSASNSQGNLATDNSTKSNSSFTNAFNFARFMGPIYPVHAFDAQGQPIMNAATGQQWFDYGMHPGAVNRPIGAMQGRHLYYETLLNTNLNRRTLVSARGYADISFLKDFTFTPSISIDMRNNNGQVYWNDVVGDGVSYDGYAYQSTSNIRSYTFNQILKYTKNIEDHHVTALLGHENYDFNYRTFNATKTGQTVVGNPEFGNFVTPYGVGGYLNNDRIESYLSRVTYNYAEKYFFEGSLRRDGSSRFSKQNRWGTFYSLGASWELSKEKFLEDKTWIDDLRVKLSYGEVGNNSLLATDGETNIYYGYQSLYDLGWNNGSEPGVLFTAVANPNLTWETSKTLNAGVSFGFFKNRLYGTIEYFKRGSDGLIFAVPQPQSNIVTTIMQNIGSMYNKGIEIQLAGDIIRSKDFTWNLVTNWTLLKNRITKMPEATPEIVSGNKKLAVGHDLYSFWLRQFAGVDPSDGSALYIPSETAKPETKRVVNGVEYVTTQTNAKFDYSGTAIPDLIGSFNLSFRFRDLTLSFLVNYQLGGKIYDANYASLMTPSYGQAMHSDVLKSWTAAGQNVEIPRIDIGNTVNLNAASSRWLTDASYLSFRNVNLAYTLPKELLNKITVSNARVFITGENLGLLSKRKGLNPTESFNGSVANTYLPSRTISFGLSFSM